VGKRGERGGEGADSRTVIHLFPPPEIVFKGKWTDERGRIEKEEKKGVIGDVFSPKKGRKQTRRRKREGGEKKKEGRGGGSQLMAPYTLLPPLMQEGSRKWEGEKKGRREKIGDRDKNSYRH